MTTRAFIDEEERLKAVYALGLLDTAPEADFDEIARLAAEILQAPIALVSLADRERHWFKATVGLQMREIPRCISFCDHTLRESDLMMEVGDLLADERFRENPNVIAGARVRFYAGAALITPEGYPVGTLCVLDTQPRQLTREQRHVLETLSRAAITHILMRRQLAELRALHEARRSEAERNRILFERHPQAMFVYRAASLEVVDANEAALALYGYTRAEFLERTVRDLCCDIDGCSLLTDSGFPLCKRHRRKDGTVFPVDVSQRTIELDTEEVVLLQAVDASERIEAELSARETEALLRMAGRVARLGAWTVDVPALKHEWSDTTREIHEVEPGRKPEVGELFNFYPAEDQRALRPLFERCMTEGAPFDVEANFTTARGRSLRVRVLGEAVRDDAGRITRVQGAIQDITAQKAVEAERDRIARKLSAMLDTLSDAFLTFDRDWRFTYINSEGVRLLQRPIEQMVGSIVWDVFPEAVGTRFELEYKRAARDGVSVMFEDYYAPLKTWFEVRAFPSAEGLAVYFHDVTQRRAAADKLREQAELLDRARDAIVVRDLDGRVTYWNRAAELLYGWTIEEAVGGRLDEQIFPEPGTLLAAVSATLRQGEWTGEFEQRTRGARAVTVESRWSLVRDAAGLPKSILTISSDITERRKLEQQYRRAQRLESIGTMAGGIAHDLNNILTPILASVGLLRDTGNASHAQEVIGMLEASALRGRDLVQQILAFARGTEGQRMPLGLSHLVGELHRVLRETFPRSIAIDVSVPKELWTVEADPTQINQVILNLAVNARDAMPQGGRLAISATNREIDSQEAALRPGVRPGLYVQIEVSDNGVGIPKSHLDRIFEPFYTTKEVGRGTGLGLANVHSIVRSHAGSIDVYSEEGLGTVFKVLLPASPGVSLQTYPVRPEPLPRGAGECVLLVDDEVSIRSIARRTLESYGYVVFVAEDGAEAVATLARNLGKVRLVLTDMAMPILDGPALLAALRRIAPDLPVIVMSGLDGNAKFAKAADAGVRHFLPKPFSAGDLLGLVKRVLVEDGKQREAAKVAGP